MYYKPSSNKRCIQKLCKLSGLSQNMHVNRRQGLHWWAQAGATSAGSAEDHRRAPFIRRWLWVAVVQWGHCNSGLECNTVNNIMSTGATEVKKPKLCWVEDCRWRPGSQTSALFTDQNNMENTTMLSGSIYLCLSVYLDLLLYTRTYILLRQWFVPPFLFILHCNLCLRLRFPHVEHLHNRVVLVKRMPKMPIFRV